MQLLWKGVWQFLNLSQEMGGGFGGGYDQVCIHA